MEIFHWPRWHWEKLSVSLKEKMSPLPACCLKQGGWGNQLSLRSAGDAT